MTLCDVVEREQLAVYYEQNGLIDSEDKIRKLREDMGIIAIKRERNSTPEDILDMLEESALEGYWRAT